jgi:hypothetical protein
MHKYVVKIDSTTQYTFPGEHLKLECTEPRQAVGGDAKICCNKRYLKTQTTPTQLPTTRAPSPSTQAPPKRNGKY